MVAGDTSRDHEHRSDLGAEFAKALAARAVGRLSVLIDPEIDFRGMTPSRTWEATDREALLDILLGSWFEVTDEIQAVERLESDAFADRERWLPPERQQSRRALHR